MPIVYCVFANSEMASEDELCKLIDEKNHGEVEKRLRAGQRFGGCSLGDLGPHELAERNKDAKMMAILNKYDPPEQEEISTKSETSAVK